MLLFGEILKLKESDYRPILVNMLSDNTKKQKIKKINKNTKTSNNEIRKIERQCGLLW